MNIPKRILILQMLLVMTGVLKINALDVTVEAGGLKEAVGGDVAVTTLAVKGTLDIRDFDYISSELRNLKQLDMSGASISAYDGDATFLGRKTSPANTLPECALMGTPLEHVILPAALKAIGDGAMGNTSLKTIVIPEGVTAVGAGAFGECKSLETATFPVSVTEIGDGVFQGCVSLVSVTLPAGMKQIPARMFKGCGRLSGVTLPSSVTAIGDDAFNGCVSLDRLAMPASLAVVGQRAFNGAGLETVDMEKCAALKTIGEWAFAGCTDLKDVVLSAGLEKIGKGAFYNDGAMTPSSLPASLTGIDDFALRGIGAADPNLIADTSLDSIGAYGIAGWKGVQTLTLPESLEYIGDGAMANWTSLKTIHADATLQVPALGEDVWRGVDQPSVDLNVPYALFEEYRNTPQWAEFNVKVGTSGDVTASPEPEIDNTGVTARFEGMTLHLESSVDIAGVQFYDTAGRLYSLPVSNLGTMVSVDTSAWDAPVMIVRVILSDRSSATLKLSR